MPGVSRNGATLAAARAARLRARRTRTRSRATSRCPVIAGAAALKGVRLARRGPAARVRARFAAGVAASFASTLGSARLIRAVERDRSLRPTPPTGRLAGAGPGSPVRERRANRCRARGSGR